MRTCPLRYVGTRLLQLAAYLGVVATWLICGWAVVHMFKLNLLDSPNAIPITDPVGMALLEGFGGGMLILVGILIVIFIVLLFLAVKEKIRDDYQTWEDNPLRGGSPAKWGGIKF